VDLWAEGVSGGGAHICIFIEQRILNEARVSSYIQDILRLEEKKTFKYVILVIKDEF